MRVSRWQCAWELFELYLVGVVFPLIAIPLVVLFISSLL